MSQASRPASIRGMADSAHIGFRLSAQRALLGNVSPALRNVSLSVDEGQRKWRVQFVFTTAASDYDLDLACSVVTEIMADFPDWECSEECQRCDPPAHAERLEWCIYARSEDDNSRSKKASLLP